MTCRCGYGFCYLCGGPRDGVNAHYCRPKKKRVPPPPPVAAAPNESANQGSSATTDDYSGLIGGLYFLFLWPLDLLWLILVCLLLIAVFLLVVFCGLIFIPFKKGY